MRIFTLIFGCILILTTLALISQGFVESLDFSALVNMNWTTSTAFHKNPIAPYFETLQHQTKVYAIIFDAGSTGTRIHVYKFRYCQNETFPYVLVDELYEEIKPGLSSFAAHPTEVKLGILKLLQSAKRKIPKPFWSRTWMTLKATAGLRLLREGEAQALLNEVESTLVSSGFQLMPNGVSIMSGLDEGILSWVTVNFLLQRVRQPVHSYGTIDLGGGSLQITFVPSALSAAADVPEGFLHEVRLGSSTRSIYSHSYLGLGLMSARYCVLIGCHSSSDTLSNSTTILSECVPHGYHGHWTFGGVRYLVNSTVQSPDTSLFPHCYLRTQRLVTRTIPVHYSSELANKQFYVFSYFYDRVKDAGFLSDELQEQQITPAHYGALAKRVCSPISNPDPHRKPFLCLDLTYIYALLKDGFRFHDSTPLHLTKKINNIELGWSLGAVFDLLYNTEKV